MKQLFLAGLSAVVMLAACNSRHATSTTTTTSNAAYTVPANIQTSFTMQYPNATEITWSPYDLNTVPIDWDLTDWTVLTPKDYAVTYTMNGNKYYSWYDVNGNWIGTSYVITNYNNSLPAAVNQAISNSFSGYSIDKAHQIIWKDQTAYDIKLKNGNNKMKVLIDTNGNILKQKDK